MYLDDLYGVNGEKWFFNPENYGRQLYRRPGDKKKKLPMMEQLQKDFNPQQLMKDLDNWELINSHFLFGQDVHVTTRPVEEPESVLREFLEKAEHTDISIEALSPGIEDCFLDLMKAE